MTTLTKATAMNTIHTYGYHQERAIQWFKTLRAAGEAFPSERKETGKMLKLHRKLTAL